MHNTHTVFSPLDKSCSASSMPARVVQVPGVNPFDPDQMIADAVRDFLLESDTCKAIFSAFVSHPHLVPVRAVGMVEHSFRFNVRTLINCGYLLYLHDGFRA